MSKSLYMQLNRELIRREGQTLEDHSGFVMRNGVVVNVNEHNATKRHYKGKAPRNS